MGEIFGKILAPAFVVGIIGYFIAKQFDMQIVRPSDFGFLVGMIPVIIFFVRLGLNANEEEKPGLLALLPIFVAGGAFFMILHLNGSAMTQWARDFTDRRPGIAAGVPSSIISSRTLCRATTSMPKRTCRGRIRRVFWL